MKWNICRNGWCADRYGLLAGITSHALYVDRDTLPTTRSHAVSNANIERHRGHGIQRLPLVTSHKTDQPTGRLNLALDVHSVVAACRHIVSLAAAIHDSTDCCRTCNTLISWCRSSALHTGRLCWPRVEWSCGGCQLDWGEWTASWWAVINKGWRDDVLIFGCTFFCV